MFATIKVALAAALGAAAFGLFFSSQSLAQTAFTICASKSGNVTYAKKGNCPKGSTTLTVDAAGIQGPPGPEGATGPQGSPGPQGPAGGSPGSAELAGGGLQLIDSNGAVVGPLYPGLNGASGPSTVVQLNGAGIQIYLARDGSDFFNPPNTGSGIELDFADSNCATQPLLQILGTSFLTPAFVSNGVLFYSIPSQQTNTAVQSTCLMSPPSTRGNASSITCGTSCTACGPDNPCGNPAQFAPAQAVSVANFVPPFSIR